MPPGQQRAWLCKRARWRIIDSWHVTSHEITTGTLPDQPGPAGCEDNALANIAADRFWKEITTAVPQRSARAAYLRWHEQRTMTDIAKHLGVDGATVLRDLNSVLDAARQLGDQIDPAVSGDYAGADQVKITYQLFGGIPQPQPGPGPLAEVVRTILELSPEQLRARQRYLEQSLLAQLGASASPSADPRPDMMATARVEPERKHPEPVMIGGGMPHIEDIMDTAARVLSLAQQTADQAIADARREADETLGRARREADEVLTKARR